MSSQQMLLEIRLNSQPFTKNKYISMWWNIFTAGHRQVFHSVPVSARGVTRGIPHITGVWALSFTEMSA